MKITIKDITGATNAVPRVLHDDTTYIRIHKRWIAWIGRYLSRALLAILIFVAGWAGSVLKEQDWSAVKVAVKNQDWPGVWHALMGIWAQVF